MGVTRNKSQKLYYRYRQHTATHNVDSSSCLLNLGSACASAQEVPGRIWDGKESVLAALAALCKAAPTQFADPSEAACARAVVDALVSAARRPKASFRNAAVVALETALGSLDGDFYEEAGSFLCEELHRAVAAQQKVMLCKRTAPLPRQALVWAQPRAAFRIACLTESDAPAVEARQRGGGRAAAAARLGDGEGRGGRMDRGWPAKLPEMGAKARLQPGSFAQPRYPEPSSSWCKPAGLAPKGRAHASGCLQDSPGPCGRQLS